MNISNAQNEVLLAAIELVNGGLDMEEALRCYTTISKYVVQTVPPDKQNKIPTVQEIQDLYDWMQDEFLANHDATELPLNVFAEAVLVKWGNMLP